MWHWYMSRQISITTDRRSRKRYKYMWTFSKLSKRHFKSVGEMTVIQKIMSRPFGKHLKEIRLDPTLHQNKFQMEHKCKCKIMKP